MRTRTESRSPEIGPRKIVRFFASGRPLDLVAQAQPRPRENRSGSVGCVALSRKDASSMRRDERGDDDEQFMLCDFDVRGARPEQFESRCGPRLPHVDSEVPPT